jgi:hypothetical protein
MEIKIDAPRFNWKKNFLFPTNLAKIAMARNAKKRNNTDLLSRSFKCLSIGEQYRYRLGKCLRRSKQTQIEQYFKVERYFQQRGHNTSKCPQIQTRIEDYFY